MLSRVADALFWMSRYLERAEQVARLVDVCFHLQLDLYGVIAGPSQLHWSTLAAILQPTPPPLRQAGAVPHLTISHWLTFDMDNPISIMTCLNRARNNARSIRGTITPTMWRELNTLFLQLRDPAFSAQARESPHDFYQAVERGSQAFQGICDATMNHDEGWQFIQLGKYLERADKTLRILDIQYQLLHDMTSPVELPLAHLQWASVLRSCLAYEVYQKLYVGRIEAVRVVEFLLLHPESPRSVLFCLDAATRALQAIEDLGPNRGVTPVGRAFGRVLNELRYAELEVLMKGDFHRFLSGVVGHCARASAAVQEQYSLQ